MLCITCDGLAVSLFYFVFRSSVAAIEEYTFLYLKQKGLSAVLIGLVPVLGVITQVIGIPLTSYLSDKFRSRKLFLLLAILAVIPNILSFLAVQFPQKDCALQRTNSSLVNEITVVTKHGDHARSYSKASGMSSDDESLRRSAAVNIPSKASESAKNVVREQLNFMLAMVGLRGIYELLRRFVETQIVVATMTHTKHDTAKFGYYACWGQVGAGVSLFIIGILVGYVGVRICGDVEPGYFLAFYYAAAAQLTALIPLHWLKFEYLEKKVIDYEEVKTVFFNPHYILMLAICLYSGMSTSFQLRWEFWYIEELHGGPILFAVGGFIRRPLTGLWLLLTRPVISRLGEYNAMCLGLSLFSGSFTGLAFVRAPWLVIVCNIFQSLAFVLLLTSMVIHFAKAGSKASSAFIQGMVSMIFGGVGKEIGTVVFGYLFSAVGTKVTLCCFAIFSLLVLVILLLYLTISDDHIKYAEKTNLASDDEQMTD